MAGTSSTSKAPENDVEDLTEALMAQQQLLQRLSNELEMEREASSTAASEALSMILRLQGEKASLKMEASQYNRMAEEKICHAEEALELLEDLIYQKEMEIASLEFQVQAYRYRLLSMGCNDTGLFENSFPKNLLKQMKDGEFAEKGVGIGIRRLDSLTPIPIKGVGSGSKPLLQSNLTVVEEIESQEIDGLMKKSGKVSANTYREQIKKLDERIKEISESKDFDRNNSAISRTGTWSPSLFSQMNNGVSIDQRKEVNRSKQQDGSGSSSSVQDIFEVTETTDAREKLFTDGKSRIRNPCLISEESDERAHKPATIRAGGSEIEYHQLNQRIGHLERAKNNAKHGILEGEDQMNLLLKEIRQQLNAIQLEMRTLMTKKSHVQDEPSLEPLREAMLYFWL